MKTELIEKHNRHAEIVSKDSRLSEMTYMCVPCINHQKH